MTPLSSGTIFTIGHSNRELDEFIALLQLHRIGQLVDVRAFPGSRRQPNFGRDLLELTTPRLGDLTFLRTAASIKLDALGLSAVARQVEQAGLARAVDRLSLDGMLALWQPAAGN